MPGAGGDSDEKDAWVAPEVTDSESDPVDLVREKITVCTINSRFHRQEDRFEVEVKKLSVQYKFHRPLPS